MDSKEMSIYFTAHQIDQFSAIRDASNTGWVLSASIKGRPGNTFLDTTRGQKRVFKTLDTLCSEAYKIAGENPVKVVVSVDVKW